LQDDEIAGHKIHRGDLMLISIFGVQRNPDEWEAPDEFRPERFTGEWNRLAFMPFAAGKHQCLGNTFAHLEIMTALAMIAQRFEISLPADFQVGERAFITLTPDREIPLQLKRR
jgi:cytochrome P450